MKCNIYTHIYTVNYTHIQIIYIYTLERYMIYHTSGSLLSM